MVRMCRAAIAVSALAFAACRATSLDAHFDTRPGEIAQLILRVGDDARVPGTILRVGFLRLLSDSRCPTDVVCVWQGNAALEIGLALGTGPTMPATVNSGLEPRSAELGQYRVTLLQVLPSPVSTARILPDAYRARLLVERLAT
jgi:hypothetical protein